MKNFTRLLPSACEIKTQAKINKKLELKNWLDRNEFAENENFIIKKTKEKIMLYKKLDQFIL